MYMTLDKHPSIPLESSCFADPKLWLGRNKRGCNKQKLQPRLCFTVKATSLTLISVYGLLKLRVGIKVSAFNVFEVAVCAYF